MIIAGDPEEPGLCERGATCFDLNHIYKFTMMSLIYIYMGCMNKNMDKNTTTLFASLFVCLFVSLIDEDELV